MDKYTVGLEGEHVFNQGANTFSQIMYELSRHNADAWWQRDLGCAKVTHNESSEYIVFDGYGWPYGTQDEEASLALAMQDKGLIEDLKAFMRRVDKVLYDGV
jgi:hypothetical protein